MHQAWGKGLLGLIALGALAFAMDRSAIPQDQAYHAFVDTRSLLGIPNAANVISNVALLIPGVLGLFLTCGKPVAGAVWSWRILFLGSGLITFGSGYYHWRPENWTLMWDRFPMTLCFMSLFSLLLCEFVFTEKDEPLILPPLLLGGLASVIYWYIADDLRFYIWIQAFPLFCIVLIPLLFPSRFSHRRLLFLALGFYAFAKVAERYDGPLFLATDGVLSGHSLKHILAGLSSYVLYHFVRRRHRL